MARGTTGGMEDGLVVERAATGVGEEGMARGRTTGRGGAHLLTDNLGLHPPACRPGGAVAVRTHALIRILTRKLGRGAEAGEEGLTNGGGARLGESHQGAIW